MITLGWKNEADQFKFNFRHFIASFNFNFEFSIATREEKFENLTGYQHSFKHSRYQSMLNRTNKFIIILIYLQVWRMKIPVKLIWSFMNRVQIQQWCIQFFWKHSIFIDGGLYTHKKHFLNRLSSHTQTLSFYYFQKHTRKKKTLFCLFGNRFFLLIVVGFFKICTRWLLIAGSAAHSIEISVKYYLFLYTTNSWAHSKENVFTHSYTQLFVRATSID